MKALNLILTIASAVLCGFFAVGVADDIKKDGEVIDVV